MSDPASSKNRTALLIALAVLAGAIILLVVTELASTKEAPAEGQSSSLPAPATDASAPADRGPATVRAFAAGRTAPRTAPDGERSPLADALNAPSHTIRDDLAIVAGLFANYLEQFHELPVGDNAEITAALAGDNRRGHAPLPPGHRAISAAGELTDRWGTPFFFHQLAGTVMEIRSAGPDRRLHNADDIVWPEPAVMAAAATAAR